VGVIAFASAKSSPGVTTTIAALAATWPVERELHIAELDAAGGDLVVRFELAPEPGLVTLAATGRRDLSPETYLAHTQPLPSPTGSDRPARRVLVGPVAPDQASAALGALRGALPKVLAAVEADVLVDCGRLDTWSPAFEFAMQADLLVVVTRPILSEIHHLAARLTSVKARAVSLLTVGDQPYGVGDVAPVVGATPLGTIPSDVRAAAALTLGHPHALRVLRRSRLLRDARSVAEGLAVWLGPPRPAAPAGRAGAPPAAGFPGPPPGPSAPYEPAHPAPPPGHEAPHQGSPVQGRPPGRDRSPDAGAGPVRPAAPAPPPPGPPPPAVAPPPAAPPPAAVAHPVAMPEYGERHPAPAGAVHGADAGGRQPVPPDGPRPVPWPSRPWTNGGSRTDGRGGSAKHFRRGADEDER
jgi:hypothetical protein